MSWLARLIRRMRNVEPHVLEPVRPRVTPDPEQAEQLRRKLEAVSYQPQNGFHKDTQVII
jgi:hypothetical protein